MRYLIELAYNGSKYHGWQVQPNAITVQEVLEKALSLKLQETIKINGAGRTDTGVHAKYFVAHLDSKKEINPKIIFGLNNILPNDIVIFNISKTKTDFNARFDAISRTYKYYISKNKDPFNINTIAILRHNINIELLNNACKTLFNYTDFTSFSKLHTDTKTNNCKITFANWEQNNDTYIFTITADRFLRNMVRSIVGTMLDLNENKISLDRFKQIIELKDRSKAGKSASAEGLFLTDIVYPKGTL